MTAHVIIGDARAGIRSLATAPDATFGCAITSPPYWGLRSYTGDRREHGVGSLDAWAADVGGTLNDLAPLLTHGTLWVVLGETKIGSGGAGGDYNAGGARNGRARYRQGDAGGRPNRSSAGAPFVLEQTMMAHGWVLRSRIVWVKTTTTGRPEYRREDLKHVKRPKMQHEYVQMWTAPGVEHFTHNVDAYDHDVFGFNDEREAGDVWHGPSARTPRDATYKAKAPYPEWLVERCLRLSRPAMPTGVRPWVIDPYAGSCTTLAVAERLAWDAVGIDLDPETRKAAMARLNDSMITVLA